MARAYSFSDLDAQAQAKALDKYRDWNVTENWWNAVYEDFGEVCKCIGVELGRRWYKGEQREVNTVHFSGFWSQGDGACFVGTYCPRVGALEAVKEHAPEDETLHGIAAALGAADVAFKLQVPEGGYRFAVRTDSSLYCHSGTMTFEGEFDCEDHEAQCEALHDVVRTQLMRLADWLYKQLEQEHEHLTSDACLKESFVDLRFDEDGVII